MIIHIEILKILSRTTMQVCLKTWRKVWLLGKCKQSSLKKKWKHRISLYSLRLYSVACNKTQLRRLDQRGINLYLPFSWKHSIWSGIGDLIACNMGLRKSVAFTGNPLATYGHHERRLLKPLQWRSFVGGCVALERVQILQIGQSIKTFVVGSLI